MKNKFNLWPWLIFYLVFGIQTSASAESIVVPFDAHYEPMSFVDKVGVPSGFDVDVAKALAVTAGIEITFVDADFFDIQSGQWPSDWGYSVASMSRDPDREINFEFIGPYLFDAVVMVTRDQNPVESVDELSDIDVGVCSGCVYADFLNGLASGQNGPPIPGARPVDFTTDPDILRDISNPESELMYGITSAFHADYYIALGSPLKKLERPLFVSPLWIVVKKEKDGLAAKIAAAFVVLEKAGKLRELSITHLEHDYTTLGEEMGR